MAVAGYALEHFYFGQVTREGRGEGELRLLAQSNGIDSGHVPEIVRTAMVPPIKGVPLGSWALVHGRAVPFILVQSQLNDAGAAMLHFIVVPPDVLRSLGGNIKGMMRLLQPTMPSYDQPGQSLTRLMMPQIGQPTNDAQIDAMLAVMSATGDRLDVVETLLAALIQGVPIIVQAAPPDPTQRAALIEGLLALLPAPARVGVTFATHTLPSTRVDAQIRFATTDAAVPPDALRYDWNSGSLGGMQVTDEYSRFIISQLRLDPEQVIMQTNNLRAVASWRIRVGDSLAAALRYASHRLKIDNSVVNNLPVEAKDAARVLNEDPTLNADLREAYARHVLALSLADGDMQHTAPIGMMLREQHRLADAIRQQLNIALTDGKADLVYEALSNWMANPLGPDGMDWSKLVQAAAVAHMHHLLATGAVEPTRNFLVQLHADSRTIDLNSAMPAIIESALSMMPRDRALAQTLFILSADYLHGERLQRLLADPAMVTQLPDPLRQLSDYYSGAVADPAPTGLLTRAAAACDADWTMLVLIRLTEVALLSNRLDLIDTPTLGLLTRAATSPFAPDYDPVFVSVVHHLSTDDLLPTLDDPGPRYLLQLLLLRGYYHDLSQEMPRHARVLYSTDKQDEYALMVRRVFAETTLAQGEAPQVLLALEAADVKPLPLVMAHFGVLSAANWPGEMHPLALKATTLLFENRAMVEAVPPASIMELLTYHVERRDEKESIRTAGLMPQVAAHRGEGGAALMTQMYQMMSWDERPRLAALEVLRRYIRVVDLSYARQAVRRLAEALGREVGRALETSYRFRMLMQGQDIATYAANLHAATDFLRQNAVAYADRRNLPSINTLFAHLDNLSNGITTEDRAMLAKTLLSLGRLILRFSDQQPSRRGREQSGQAEALVKGESRPATPLDVMWIIGGYFARGQRASLQIEHETHARPLGESNAVNTMTQLVQTETMLRALQQAFPTDRRVTLSVRDIRTEIESLWGDLPLAERRDLVQDLARDPQILPDLVLHLAESGSRRALEERGRLARRLETNRQKPEGALEFYRFAAGYLRGRSR